MHILHTTPHTDGFCMPAEFDRHAGCLLIWPTRGDSWRSGGWPARKAFAAVAAAIARSEEVTMLVAPEQYETARAMLPPEVRLVEMETDDSWARDVCPTFVRNAEGTVRGIDWGFNAWGGLVDGLYFPWDKDNHAARKVCDLYRADCYDSRDFILEGGSIHSDGEGTILTTESCLCSAGRNPDMTKAEIEEKLCSMLGAQKVLWLPRGIYGDETNEHVDNVCAFTAAGKVVLAWTDNQNDPQYALSKACADYLAQQTDAKGRKLEVTLLPIPQEPVCITQEECSELDLWDGEPTRTAGERLAASYVNFYIANDSVLVPQFGDPMDKTACEILSAQFPNRTIVPIAAREILLGGGNIHCITADSLRKEFYLCVKSLLQPFKWHALPMPPKTAALPKRWYGRQPETGHRSFCCRNCSKPLTSVRNGGTPPMNWQPRRRKILPLHSCGKSLRNCR